MTETVLSITAIRNKYPAPQPDGPATWAREADSAPCYCVGGAIILAHGGAEAFPNTAYLANWLQALNPCLTHEQALWFAADIINSNDAQDVEQAWALAERALTVYVVAA